MRTVWALCVAVVWSAAAYASDKGMVIASYSNDFAGPVPTNGWAYLWNANGAIGDPANYTGLVWNGSYYDNDGVPGLPGPVPGAYVFLDRTSGHPGNGSAEGAVVDRYAIAGFTLSEGLEVDLTNARFTVVSASSEGVQCRVYVNTTLYRSVVGYSYTSPMVIDTSLGHVDSGATVYVALGPYADARFDSFYLDYTLMAVPEPAAMALLIAGIIRRKRLWSRC